MNLPHDFPEKLVDRIRQLYPESWNSILEGFKQTRATTFRVNTLKNSVNEFLAVAIESGIDCTQSEWNQLAFLLNAPPLRTFSESSLYKEGKCYVQSFSSMIPPIVLDPKPGEAILDIAAAPGSKTSQMAAMMNNTGSILANDSSQIRIYKLSANLIQQGVTNTTVRRGVGQTLWQDYPEYFDKVLVDVPCSMEGRIQLSDPKSYGFWSTKKVKELADIQKYLLRSAISATKVGGTICYSTCTLSPEENEGVIDWILRKEAGKVVLEDIALPCVPVINALQQWNSRLYHPDIHKTVRILPDMHFEGFYIAKLKKISPSVSKSL